MSTFYKINNVCHQIGDRIILFIFAYQIVFSTTTNFKPVYRVYWKYSFYVNISLEIKVPTIFKVTKQTLYYRSYQWNYRERLKIKAAKLQNLWQTEGSYSFLSDLFISTYYLIFYNESHDCICFVCKLFTYRVFKSKRTWHIRVRHQKFVLQYNWKPPCYVGAGESRNQFYLSVLYYYI